MAPVSLWQKICAGLFVVLAVGVWLYMSTSLRNPQQGRAYHIFLDQSVRGLAASSLVCYNGIAVGKVKEITNDFQQDRVRVDILITNKDVKISRDYKHGDNFKPGTRARLVTSFVTGIQYIDLSGGDSTCPPLKKGEILAETSADIDRISAKATQILDKVNEIFSPQNRKSLQLILYDLKAITANVNQQLVTDNRSSAMAKLHRILGNIEKISGRSNQQLLQRTMENITQGSDDLRSTIAGLRPQIDKVVTDLDRLLVNIDKMVKSDDNHDLTSLVRRLNQILGDNRQQLRTLLANLAEFSKELTGHLAALSQKVQESLRSFDYLLHKDLSLAIAEFKRALYDVRAMLSILKAKPNALLWGSEVKGK